MRGLLKAIVFLVLLLVIAAVAAPFLIPVDWIKNEITAQIEAKTGRKASIGHLAFSVFPTLGFEAQDVALGNAASADGGDMIAMKTLKIGMDFVSLLHKEVRLKELTLEQPVFTLVKQQRRANSDFGAPAHNAPAPTAVPEPASASQALANLRLDAITIRNGTVTYRDDISAKTQTLSDIDFTLKAPDLNARADLKFSAVYEGKKSDVTLTLDQPLAFESGKPVGVNLDAMYGDIECKWKGTLAEEAGIPSLTGELTLPALNTAGFETQGAGTTAAANPAGAPAPENASRWSDAPISLMALTRANADLSVAIGSLTLPKTTLSNIHAHVKLAKGVLQVALDPVSAYGGTIQLSFAANTANAIRAEFIATHTQAEPLLHDFASYDRLSGTLDLKASVTAAGSSERALIGSLTGNGSIAFKDGKLKGVNLAGLLRRLNGAESEDAATDFSELSGTFTVVKGVVTTNDFKMSSPLLRVTGAGDADLPNWQEHFLLKPMLVGSLEGQGGKDAGGIVIPVKVDGPLNHPHYQPDLKAALEENLKNPAQLKQTLKDLKNNVLQGGKINSDTLKNLLR